MKQINQKIKRIENLSSLKQKLQQWFISLYEQNKDSDVVVAFSGGVDSSLVLACALYYFPGKTYAAIADSPSLKRTDLLLAQENC